MKNELIQNQLVVKGSPIHGYGVFAGKNINIGEIVEECYALMSRSRCHEFSNYYFNLANQCVLLMGFGSLYNHSDQPNAKYVFDEETAIATFYASQPIAKGEEIFIYYGENWFAEGNRGIKIKPRSWRYKIRRAASIIPWRALIVLVGTLGGIVILKGYK